MAPTCAESSGPRDFEPRDRPAVDALFWVSGLEFAVKDSGFMVQGSGFRVQGSGFRIQGSGFRVQVSGFTGVPRS